MKSILCETFYLFCDNPIFFNSTFLLYYTWWCLLPIYWHLFISSKGMSFLKNWFLYLPSIFQWCICNHTSCYVECISSNICFVFWLHFIRNIMKIIFWSNNLDSVWAPSHLSLAISSNSHNLLADSPCSKSITSSPA